jgi:hypothetical protein
MQIMYIVIGRFHKVTIDLMIYYKGVVINENYVHSNQKVPSSYHFCGLCDLIIYYIKGCDQGQVLTILAKQIN